MFLKSRRGSRILLLRLRKKSRFRGQRFSRCLRMGFNFRERECRKLKRKENFRSRNHEPKTTIDFAMSISKSTSKEKSKNQSELLSSLTMRSTSIKNSSSRIFTMLSTMMITTLTMRSLQMVSSSPNKISTSFARNTWILSTLSSFSPASGTSTLSTKNIRKCLTAATSRVSSCLSELGTTRRGTLQSSSKKSSSTDWPVDIVCFFC